MCGRTTLSAPEELLRQLFDLHEIALVNPRYNIAPSQGLPVIREPHKLELVHWGLASAGPGRGVNVRAESVARAPQYRDLFRSRRCLVVVDGFYEWKHTGGKRKQPFLVHREDGLPFALAGLWDRNDGQDTCAIITGEAKGVVAGLHNRMPIMIAEPSYARWLDHAEPKPVDLLQPDAKDLVSHPVSELVNSPKNDDPRLLEPVKEAGNLELF